MNTDETRRTHWARVRAPGANVLRRGAWYPVIDHHVPHRVVIDAGLRDVALHPDSVDLRADLPARFSIVRRTDTDRNPATGTADDKGLVYAVCPISRSRVVAPQGTSNLECPQCGFRGPVDWGDPC